MPAQPRGPHGPSFFHPSASHKGSHWAYQVVSDTETLSMYIDMTGVVVSKTIYRGLLGNSAAGVVLWLFKLCMYIYTDDRSSRVKLSMADCCSLRRMSSPVAV